MAKMLTQCAAIALLIAAQDALRSPKISPGAATQSGWERPAAENRTVRSPSRSRGGDRTAIRCGRMPARIFSATRVRSQVGDVVTVKISIKDKASLDNNSKRSRDSERTSRPKLSYGSATGGLFAKGDHSISASAAARTSTDGRARSAVGEDRIAGGRGRHRGAVQWQYGD